MRQEQPTPSSHAPEGTENTFWSHLDVLRGCLLRIAVVVVVAGIAAFCLKEELFDFLLAPCHSGFLTYQALGLEASTLHLVNTSLTEQMVIHIKMAMTMGLLAASPYIIYILFGFVSPALYEHERRYGVRLILASYVMFLVGVGLNFLLVFPLTVQFLGFYQVSPEVENMLTISSYIDTLLMMSILFGIVFEIPVVSWLLAKFNLIRAEWMSRYRRHAIVVILIIAAIITPTTDPFTLFIVSLPIWLLYELSIFIVRNTLIHKS